jgi:DNA-binding transcriptional LysR family regulator
MSRALQRLRRHFGDELLVRGPDGYSLTPRAERIRNQLATAVTHLEQLFAPEAFDPAAAAQSFRLAVSDYTVARLGPALVRAILTESPNSTVSCEVLDARAFEKLDAGTLDLVIYGRTAPERYCSEHLFTERFVCVVAAEHPLAHQTSVSLSTYLRWPHLAIEIDQPWIDLALEALGTPRRIAVSMPYFALAPSILPGTELILTIAAQLAHDNADRARTRVLAAPREFGELEFYAVWHPRFDQDPSHRWLRHVVRTVAVPPSPRRGSATGPGRGR